MNSPVASARRIIKIGLAHLRDGQLLVVRKRGTPTFILPGGKPEARESDVDALHRECMEELGCQVGDLVRLATFTGPAADRDGVQVEVRVWLGSLRGSPAAASEIEELAWIDVRGSGRLLAPTITQGLLPKLVELGLM